MMTLGWVALQVVTVLAPIAAPINAPPVPDKVLSTMRGGFRLPSGIDVALTVETQTAVDGAVVLKTVFRADQGTPTLTVYAPQPGTRVVSAAGTATATAGATPPTVTFDNRSGIQVTPGLPGTSIAVTAPSSQQASNTVPDGLVQAANGQPITTDNGVVTESAQGGLDTATLQGVGLSITHFAGNAFGSAIANSGNDRTIDTQTTVSLDLHNAGPDVLGSSMLRVQDLGLDALSSRMH